MTIEEKIFYGVLLHTYEEQYPMPELWSDEDKLCDIRCDYCKYHRICYLEYLKTKVESEKLKEYIEILIEEKRKQLYG